MKSAIDKLSEGQKDCLRLVLQLKQTKEIARELGISPDTVKQRIGIAMRTLGADSRVQAARMLETEENSIYPQRVYTPPDLVPEGIGDAGGGATDEVASRASEPAIGTSVSLEGDGAQPGPSLVSPHREIRDDVTLGGLAIGWMVRLLLGDHRPGGGVGNRLGSTQRLALIFLIALGAILSVTGLIAAIHQLVLLRR
jgi:DNA-binding CsgD family transcriptional regulator